MARPTLRDIVALAVNAPLKLETGDHNMQTTNYEQKVWDGPFHFLDSVATSAGIENAAYSITVNGETGEVNAIRLCADLTKLGATVTQSGSLLTVRVSREVADKFFELTNYSGELKKDLR